MKRTLQLVPAGAALLLGACSLAPRYQPPAAPQVSALKEAGDWVPARPADGEVRGPWWESFKDPGLSELEGRLLIANQDLRAAAARFQQARQVARAAGSNLLPSVGATASATRERSSANSPLATLGAGHGGSYDDFLTGLQLSWEIDLFGRLRNTLAAARAQAEASAADYGAVLLSLQAELASDYFALRGDDATIVLLEDTIKQYDRAWEATRNRYREGTAAATDVDQADTLRQNARAQLSAVRLQRAQLEHAIAVLIGELPSTFSLPAGELAAMPPVLDTPLPSTLLQHRPDVAAAERGMAAANAEIGIARAAWFPVFSLAGAAGFESTMARSWLDAPSHFWSLGPQASVPLLDAGGRLARTRQARAAFDEATATYRKTTLTAYQEVEDSLAGLHHLAEQLKADQAASASAQSSAYHADQRYAAGVADYLEVTTTHTAALNAQRDTLNARVALLNACVALVRATGGGWTGAQMERPALP